MFSKDFVFIKNLNYIVQKYILSTYAKVFLTNKKNIIKIIKKHRQKINKQNRIKEEIRALSVFS